jgi:cytidylate kinase
VKLTMPAYEPGANRIIVDGRRVGTALASDHDWTAHLAPVADIRGRQHVDCVRAPSLRDLRTELRRRLAEDGPWWTTAEAREAAQ